MKKRLFKKVWIIVTLILPMLLFIPGADIAAALPAESSGQVVSQFDPALDIKTLADEKEPEVSKGIIEQLALLLGSRSKSVQIIAMLTVLSLAPSILMMLTSFTRIIIVLSFTRNALGMQQMPPNQVIVGLALMLTFFIMGPVINEVKTEAYTPYIKNEITIEQATDRAIVPIRTFMLKQTFKDDLGVFVEMSGETAIVSAETVPMRVLMPAFITSEIKRGFMIGFFIYIPFIVIDMIVASTLMAMGMMMLPPTVISLPFKVLLFILVDGWLLTIKTLVTSFT